MSNFIGDYIHLSASNYLKYGINYPRSVNSGGVNFNNPRSLIQNFVSKVKNLPSTVSPQTIKDLEEGYKLVNNLNTTVNLANGPTTILEILQARVDKDLKEASFDYTLDFDKGTVHYQGGKGIGKVSAHHYGDVMGFDAKEITRKLDDLQKALYTLQNGGFSSEQATELQDRINTLNDVISWGFTKINNVLYKNNNAKLKINGKEAGIKWTRKEINDLISIIAACPPIALAEGNIFETKLSMMSLVEKVGGVGGAIAEKTVEDIIKTIGNSKNIEVHPIPREKFFKYINDSQIYLDEGNSYLKTSTSLEQGKVDVVFTSSENEKVNISAKSYSFTNKGFAHINVGSNASLLAALSDLGGEFINHYLNIYARHYTFNGMNRSEDVISVGDDGLSQQRKSFVQPLKQYLLYKELTGDYSNRKSINGNSDIPDILAVNNKTSGGVRFIPINNILKVVLESPDLISVTPNLADLRFSNTYVPTLKGNSKSNVYSAAYQRIANLLGEVHQTNIKVGFNFNWNGTY